MNRQFCTIAILTTLGALSFAPIAKAGLTLNGTSADGSTIDRAQSSLQSDVPPSSDFYGSNLNGTSLDGSTIDRAQPSLQSDDQKMANQDNVTGNE